MDRNSIRNDLDCGQSVPRSAGTGENPAPERHPENALDAARATRSSLMHRQCSILERFLDKIALDDENGACWIWLGAKDSAGYARFHVTRVIGKAYSAKAYRWAYEHWNGPIPSGMHLHHVCEVPACVNPDHLQVMTPGEHTLIGRNESALNARKTHCKRGHAFDETNTYWFNGGRSRACRTCKRVSDERARVSLASRGAS